MNQRESSGLPLRAMVMVLLFLGVVFLLVAFQSMGSDDDSDSLETTAVTTATASPTTTEPSEEPAAERPAVRVYNISEVAGAADRVATQLKDQQWDVTETGNRVLEVPETTVYYGEAPGEREGAEEVGKILAAPVAERIPELSEEPPGVIVIVTG